MGTLFVYGTLRPGLAPAEVAPLVARFIPIGPAWVEGRLYDLGRYPCLVLGAGTRPGAAPSRGCEPPGGRVSGLLVRLPDDPELLRRLDEYEGHDSRNPARSRFLRAETTVHVEAGGEARAWVYVWNGGTPSGREIAGGDYLAYREGRLAPHAGG